MKGDCKQTQYKQKRGGEGGKGMVVFAQLERHGRGGERNVAVLDSQTNGMRIEANALISSVDMGAGCQFTQAPKQSASNTSERQACTRTHKRAHTHAHVHTRMQANLGDAVQ